MQNSVTPHRLHLSLQRWQRHLRARVHLLPLESSSETRARWTAGMRGPLPAALVIIVWSSRIAATASAMRTSLRGWESHVLSFVSLGAAGDGSWRWYIDAPPVTSLSCHDFFPTPFLSNLVPAEKKKKEKKKCFCSFSLYSLFNSSFFSLCLCRLSSLCLSIICMPGCFSESFNETLLFIS